MLSTLGSFFIKSRDHRSQSSATTSPQVKAKAVRFCEITEEIPKAAKSENLHQDGDDRTWDSDTGSWVEKPEIKAKNQRIRQTRGTPKGERRPSKLRSELQSSFESSNSNFYSIQDQCVMS